MTCRHAPSAARLVLLVLLAVTPRLAGAAPVEGEGREGALEGRTRTHRKEDAPGPLHTLVPEQSQGDSPRGYDPARALASMLLGVLEPPETPATQERWDGERREGQGTALSQAIEEEEVKEEEVKEEEKKGGGGEGEEEQRVEGEEEEDERAGAERRMEQLASALVAAVHGEQTGEGDGGEERRRLEEEQGVSAGEGSEEGGEQKDKEEQEEEEEEERLDGKAGLRPIDSSLQRKIRGYFQNIDLGLQDNEILPPLKGYKAYNTQLARAGKKLRWKEEEAQNRPLQGGNFMDDFENEGEEELEEMEDEARAEKQEVQRQQEEAERAREEEQRLADIASDMLLQYMGKKQQGAPSYLTPQQKSSGGLNAAEDKRSEELVAADDTDDDLDQQMIDRLIEISSKLHLPADDVVEIISDVEEKKKKKRKELLLPASGGNPGNSAAPRFRPLVPLPLPAPPVYHYTASSNPKKNPYAHRAYRKKDKGKSKNKSYKQDYWSKPQKQLDYWSKPQKQLDYWSKPQKQFLAFPSYPYYQKPYRAYYPVYFPHPKQHYYGKPPPSRDQMFGPQDFGPQDFGPQDFGPQDFGPQDFGPRASPIAPPRYRHRDGSKSRGQGWRHRAGSKSRGQGWRQQPVVRLPPSSPHISNYILPHPRTYQPLPPPKPRIPPYLYPPVAPRNDYEEDGLVPQMDSEEELENFIERIYMKRRMY